jgi:hypothetical protein
MRFIGLREVRGVEASEASRPDFTGVTVPQASPFNIKGEGAELGAWQGWVKWHMRQWHFLRLLS